MIDIVATEEFSEWYLALNDADAEATTYLVEMLETTGVGLDHPYSSAIKGTKIALRELRVQSQGRPLRVFYAFDPNRSAVLILGGDKTGDEKRFYKRMIPLVERYWSKYLTETNQQ